MHPLDRPVWHSLLSDWAPIAGGNDLARRIDRRFNVFGAAADLSEAAQDALAALVRESGETWVVEPDAWPAPPGCAVVRTAALVQMVCVAPPSVVPAPLPIVPLGDADAAELNRLLALTRPGPFAAETYRIGEFVGMREGGRLVAAAGERMRPPGFAEVSGVCTDPAQRGRGLASALIAAVTRRIVARGHTPWLTSYADNAKAIALYEALGFVLRRRMTLTILAPAI